MSGLFTFQQDIPLALEVFTQNSINGFPVYSSTDEPEAIYKDTYPQLVRLAEPASFGDLLHVKYDSTGVHAVLASAHSPSLYCNSVCLATGAVGALVPCGIRSAVVRMVSAFTGPVFLSDSPGMFVGSPGMGEITQCVGWASNTVFHFHFHTPALNSPEDYSHLGTNHG